VDVDFWKLDPHTGEEVSLNADDRRATNDVIRNYVGSYDDFILTTMSLQGQNALFIDKTQAERKDLMNKFVGIDVFDELYVSAYESFKENGTILRRLTSENLPKQLADVEVRIDTLTQEYNYKRGEYDEFISEKDELGRDLVELTQKVVDVDKSITDIKTLRDEKQRTLHLLKENGDVYKTLETKVGNLKEELDECRIPT
jgi:DNA repair exonuclease SbcCD ATPase subunit